MMVAMLEYNESPAALMLFFFFCSSISFYVSVLNEYKCLCSGGFFS